MKKEQKLNQVFKYTDIKGAKEILKDNTILMKSPDQFNDPNDCDLTYNEKNSNKAFELIQEYYFLKAIKDELENNKTKKTKDLSPLGAIAKGAIIAHNLTIPKTHEFESNPLFYKQIKGLINKNESVKKQIDDAISSFKKQLDEKLQSARKKAFIGCFSKIPNAPLMWSHYSDECKGVCIEWDIQTLSDNNIFLEVLYSDNKPQIDLYKFIRVFLGYDYLKEKFDENDKHLKEDLVKLIVTKSKDWEYEKEVRIVLSKSDMKPGVAEVIGNNRALYHMAVFPSRVYLGERISQEDEKEIRQLCLKYTNCEIVRTRHSNDGYSIELY